MLHWCINYYCRTNIDETRMMSFLGVRTDRHEFRILTWKHVGTQKISTQTSKLGVSCRSLYTSPSCNRTIFFNRKKKTVVVFLTSISLRFRGPPASSASLPVHFLATDGLLCSCLQNKATWVYSYHFFFILKKKEATWLYHFFLS